MQPRPGALGPHGVLRSPARARLGRRVRGRLATPHRRSLPAPSHPACRSALPHLGGGRMTWPRSGELRKGFGSGLHGFVKGLGLTLQGTPSGLPDPKRRGAGPVGPKRSSHLLNPPMPRSRTQHPSPWVKAAQPGTGASMPQGIPSLRGRERGSRGAQADRTPQLPRVPLGTRRESRWG